MPGTTKENNSPQVTVKRLQFPTYKEWESCNFSCEVTLGPVLAKIRVVATGLHHARIFKGSLYTKPNNLGERCTIGCEHTKDEYTYTSESLQEWYEDTCEELNKQLEQWANSIYTGLFETKQDNPFELMPSGVFNNLFGCIVFSDSSDGLHRLYAAANRCFFDRLTVQALQDIFDRCRIDFGNGHIIWFSDDESKTLANYIRPKLLQKLGVDVNELTN